MGVADIVGWIGAAALLAAYALVATQYLKLEGAYYLLNVCGAIAIAFSSWSSGAFPATALNIAWAIIGIWGAFHAALK